MSAKEQTIAGLSCGDVLAGLPDYLSNDLSPEIVRSVELHLAGCTWCERFGGRYGVLVHDLRLQLQTPVPLAQDIKARLAGRLDAELGSD